MVERVLLKLIIKPLISRLIINHFKILNKRFDPSKDYQLSWLKDHPKMKL